MSHLDRLVLTLAIIFISLTLGYACRRLTLAGKLHLGIISLDALRKRLQTVAIFFLLPLSAMLSLWGLPKPETSLLFLPLLGVAAYIWGGTLALLMARFLKLNRPQTGSFYCCGTFTNIGAVGGLVCLLFLGENSIALVALYRLLEEVFYFSVSFPIARWYGEQNCGSMLNFRSFTFSPVLKVIVAALALGLCLNFAGVSRPVWCGTAASAAMLLSTVFFLFAIGLSLRLSSMFGYIRPGLGMCLIKFAGIPLLITLLARGMGYGDFDNGLTLKVVAVLSSMPVAMTALVPPSLFDLDIDLANTCWIFTTIGLIAVLPTLMVILPLL